MNVLIFGASGMLGNAVFRLFHSSAIYKTFGTVRAEGSKQFFTETERENLISGIDVENTDNLVHVFRELKPNIVINCIGLVKQLSVADDPLVALPINALLPHRLANLCALVGARFIHLSTDCVYSGEKGMYVESDPSDAKDLYGRSKYLGEVDYPHAITLRTSIIGHELRGSRSLIGWFLSQNRSVKGFKNAIFSGLPTVEIAKIIRDYVLPNNQLHGVYHVSADPINKYELLCLVAKIYNKEIDIEVDEKFAIDRSLDSSRFRSATGFSPKPWVELIESMKNFG